MADINFNVTGIENLIEDLKQTRCHCNDIKCINNLAWEKRRPAYFAPRCTLPYITITDKDGQCQERYIEAEMVGYLHHDQVTEQAIEALQKDRELLNRVNGESEYDQSVDRYSVSMSLFKEIYNHLFPPED